MSYLDKIVREQKNNEAVGITSICSANPQVLEASLRYAHKTGNVVLIESTCNQVNQFGGYTGMTPTVFVAYIKDLAERIGFPNERILIGGDHLGPNVWKKETASSAMEKSQILVRDYVRAGYQKIHVDTSMCLGDDPQGQPLEPQIVAERTADLIAISESTFSQLGHQANYIRYIIGTEVPPPGGMQGCEETALPTKPEMVQETIQLTKHTLDQRGLASVWERVIAIVVQPGVEYGDQKIIVYKPEAAAGLKNFIESINGMVYEAHSTDYQTRSALQHLIEDHYAILKVGPALTFAMREAVFALEEMENELLGHDSEPKSHLKKVLDLVMISNPEYWEKYYSADLQTGAFQRRFSLLDRCRYYWSHPEVEKALQLLIGNLSDISIPISLISQYLPNQLIKVKGGQIKNQPLDLILGKISDVIEDYIYACNLQN